MSETLATPAPVTLAPALHPAPRAPLAWWMIALLGVLAVGVYANSLCNDFAFDDLAIVRDNPRVINLEWTAIWTNNYWPKTDGVDPADALYRPLTLWSYLANQALMPGVPWPFHLVNVFLHGLVTMLVAALAWRLLGDRRIALVAAALFAVHPIHAEAVANTVGRAELLAALWSLLALLVFLPVSPLPGETPPPPRRAWWHGLLVAACFLAAMFSKETPVTLLLAVPLIDLWRWGCWKPGARPVWWRWLAAQGARYYLPLAAAFGVYLHLRIRACGLMCNTKAIHPIVNLLVDATPMQRLVTPFMLLAKYLWITFWPVHLSADYSGPSLLPAANPFYATAFQPPAAAGLLVCTLALIVALRTRRKTPHLLLLLGLFAAAYALVANFLRIGTILGERLFYWPSVFVLLMIAWAAVAAYQRLAAPLPKKRRAALAAASLLALALPAAWMARITWQRNTDWADNITLAISTARDNPNSGKACAWAGAVLEVADRPDFVAFGKLLLERSVELSPDYVNARWELAKYYGRRHELGPSAIHLAQAVRLDPGSHMSRAAIPALIQEMRMYKPETYMPALEVYQRDHPRDEAAYLALAFGYHAQMKYDEAEANARQAIDVALHVRPDGFDQYHEAGAELATIWFDAGKLKEGADKFRTYAAFMRNSPDAHCAFASMLLKLDPRTFPEALGEAEFNLLEASLIDPGNAKAREIKGQLNRLRREWNAERLSASAADSRDQKSGVGP